MEIVYLIARLWLGGLFLFFGLNGFLHFYKIPYGEGPIANFNQATVLLAPIVFNICALHWLHNPKPWGMITSLALPQLLCMAQKWEHNIRPLFEF